MHTTIAVELDHNELLLWSVLLSFESLALRQYAAYATVLVTPEKRALVQSLNSQVPSAEALEETDLATPLKDVVLQATGASYVQTLIVQGLLLESVGHAFYQMLSANESISAATRALTGAGLKASESVTSKIPKLLSEEVGDRQELFQAFMTASKPVLKSLVGLGDGLDKHFSEQFGITFADLMGEFASDLISLCVQLGMERRKIVCYLTAALMGI